MARYDAQRLRLPLLVVTLCLAAVALVDSQNDAGLFTEVTPPPTAASPDASTVRRRFVTFADEPVATTLAAKPRVILNLFPDVQLAAERVRVEPTATGFVWVGVVPALVYSTVTIAIAGETASASIHTGDHRYTVRSAGGRVYEIREVSGAAPLPEARPVASDVPVAAASTAHDAPDDGSTIDVLVLYTSTARAAQGGREAIEGLIEVGISESNQAYASSGVDQRIRLVHMTEAIVQESGNSPIDLTRLVDPSEGYLDWVHPLRDTYGADLVHLVGNNQDVCGIAELMKTLSPSFATRAFSISNHGCITNYVLAHEWGHNMGLEHDIHVTKEETGTFPFSRGYVNQAAFAPGAATSRRWRDIMAYEDQCWQAGFSCPRLPAFANPARLHLGDPMGNAISADAVRSLNAAKFTVANFRPAIPGVSIDDVSITEGHAGTRNVTFTVSLSRASSRGTSVDYVTAAGTASNLVTLSNAQPIQIPESGMPVPYPSTIAVPDGLGTISRLTVTLAGVTHNFRDDLDILLVAPSGQSVMLVSDAGGQIEVTPPPAVDWTIDDAGQPFTHQFAASGTYRPTNLDGTTALAVDLDVFPAPAPSSQPGASLSILNGMNPAGEWRLFINDDFPSDGGRLAGGWALVMATTLGGDYVATSGTLTFPAGATRGTVTIPVRGDTMFEPPEQFTLKLSGAVGLAVADNSGTATIRADDFTDDPINRGDWIKAVHIEQLRTMINSVRGLKGFPPFAFGATRIAKVSWIEAADIVDLRRALSEVCPAASYREGTITPRVTTVKAEHLTELRAAVVACQ